MTEKENRQFLKDLRECAKQAASSSKKEAIKFLVKTGMYTNIGKLKPEFK